MPNPCWRGSSGVFLRAPMRRTSHRSLAFSLLLVQLLGGGIVGLAHTREPLDAPRRIESAQHEHCPVLHDATVCIMCSFSHNRAATATPNGSVIALLPTTLTRSPNVAGPGAASARLTGDARAPPPSQC